MGQLMNGNDEGIVYSIKFIKSQLPPPEVVA